MEIVRRRRAAAKGSLVFEDGDGKPYTHSALRIRLERWCRRAKVPVRSPYALRHFYGLHQSAAGTPLQVIKDTMGHSNIQTTCVYACNQDEPHRKAAVAAEKSLRTVMGAVGEESQGS